MATKVGTCNEEDVGKALTPCNMLPAACLPVRLGEAHVTCARICWPVGAPDPLAPLPVPCRQRAADCSPFLCNCQAGAAGGLHGERLGCLGSWRSLSRSFPRSVFKAVYP